MHSSTSSSYVFSNYAYSTQQPLVEMTTPSPMMAQGAYNTPSPQLDYLHCNQYPNYQLPYDQHQFSSNGCFYGMNQTDFQGQYQTADYCSVPSAELQTQSPILNFECTGVYQESAINPQVFGLESATTTEEPRGTKRKQTKNRVKKVSKMHLNTQCSHCGTRETKMWRRNENGLPECNPCNLYERLKGEKRPEHLWNKPSAKRKRRPVAQSTF